MLVAGVAVGAKEASGAIVVVILMVVIGIRIVITSVIMILIE